MTPPRLGWSDPACGQHAVTRRGEFRGKHHDERFGVDRTAKPERDEQAARNDAGADFDRLPRRRSQRQRRLLVDRHHDALRQPGAVDGSGRARPRRFQGRHRLHRDEQGDRHRQPDQGQGRRRGRRQPERQGQDPDRDRRASETAEELRRFGELLRRELALGQFDRRFGQPRRRHPRRRADRLVLRPQRGRHRLARQDQHRRPEPQALRRRGHDRRNPGHPRRAPPRNDRPARRHRCGGRRRHRGRSRRIRHLDADRGRLHRHRRSPR